MKDHIDLAGDAQSKRTSGGGFWTAASVFSNKWRKWRNKQKIKKHNTGKNLPPLPVKKLFSRHYRETQSEIADYGLGRRSIDIDPRFSLDAPRISFGEPRYSFDEPRASWDGYLSNIHIPDIPDGPSAQIPRADMHISLDPPSFIGENLPGCSAQTRDYYLDSSSRRKKSLDRSSSIRKTAAAVVAEIDELTVASTNAKVLPTNADYIHGVKGLTCDLYPNSLRGDLSETFESTSRLGPDKKKTKKSKKWGWKILGFLHKTSSKDEEDDIYRKNSSVNGVERSWSQSWPELRREGNGGLSRNMMRSNSSVSWRHEGPFGPSFANGRRSSVDAHWNNGRRSDFAIDKRWNSTRYSPSHLDNGLLRFYLMPMRASGRRGTQIR